MVSKELAEHIDLDIKHIEDLLLKFPKIIRTRILLLRLGPKEMMSRIQQIDDFPVEFEGVK